MEILINVSPCELCGCTHEKHLSWSISYSSDEPADPQHIETLVKDFLIKEGFDIKNPSNAKAVTDKEALLEALQVIEARKLQEKNAEEAVVKAP